MEFGQFIILISVKCSQNFYQDAFITPVWIDVGEVEEFARASPRLMSNVTLARRLKKLRSKR
jgi:hypothetical protein